MNCPKCPECEGSDVNVVDGQLAVCKSCSRKKRCVFQFCSDCQRKWPQDASTTSACKLPNCALRAALLSDEKISAQHSLLRGCPIFRACPGCKALLTHTGEGCPNISCPHCSTEFCFRCLRPDCIGIYELENHILFHRLFFGHRAEIIGCRFVDNKQCIQIHKL